MVLKGLMTTSMDRLDPTSTVMAACRVMDRKKVGAIVVVENHKLCGILTYQDLVERVLLARRDPETTPVRDVMTKEVTSLAEEHSYGDALKLMVSTTTRIFRLWTTPGASAVCSPSAICFIIASRTWLGSSTV